MLRAELFEIAALFDLPPPYGEALLLTGDKLVFSDASCDSRLRRTEARDSILALEAVIESAGER